MPLNLSQTAIKLRSALQEVLYVVATANPTIHDDRNDGYIVGTRWINTSTDEEFVCVDNTNTAALWKNTTSGGGGGNINVATADPTSSDDSGDGYTVGTIWINTATNGVFIATSVVLTAAVWVRISNPLSPTIYMFTSNPTVNDDSADGYIIGDVWVNTSSDTIFMASEVTVGAAIWRDVSTVGSGGGDAIIISTSNPTINDDTGDGYVVGQRWVNTATDQAYIAVDVTAGAAIWKLITATAANQLTADASDVLEGTTVQAQLTSIANALRGAVMFGFIADHMPGEFAVYVEHLIVTGYNLQNL